MGWGSVEGADWGVLTQFTLSGTSIKVNMVGTAGGLRAEAVSRATVVPDALVAARSTGSPQRPFFEDLSERLGVVPIEQSYRRMAALESPYDQELPRRSGSSYSPQRSGGQRSDRLPIAKFGEDVHSATLFFCESALDGVPLGHSTAGDIASYLLDAVPLPVFGSPPQALMNVSSRLTAGVPATAIVASGGLHEPTPARLVIAIGVNVVWVYFGKPSLMITSAAWTRWLARRMGVPASAITNSTDQSS